MASAWVAEYPGAVVENGVMVPVPRGAPLRVQKVTFTGSPGAIAAATRTDCMLVRIYVDANACYASGTSPTATTDDVPVSAGMPEFFWTHGSPVKFSFIEQS